MFSVYQQVDALTRGVDAGLAAARAGDYERAAELLGGAAGRLPSTYSSMRETTRMFGALGSMNPQRMRDYFRACFVAGTPILCEGGEKAIEDFVPGDKVWTRNENDPCAPLALKEVEAVFINHAPIWHIHVNGQLIRTTAEHPFWVVGKGWTDAYLLVPGDVLVGHDDTFETVTDVFGLIRLTRVLFHGGPRSSV